MTSGNAGAGDGGFFSSLASRLPSSPASKLPVASGRTAVEVCRQYGLPEATLYRWKRAAKAHGGTPPDPKSTRPTASGASPIDDEHRALVLSIKAKLKNAGLAQVQNQLKRFHGVKLSRPMIGRIFTEAGIPLEKRPEPLLGRVVLPGVVGVHRELELGQVVLRGRHGPEAGHCGRKYRGRGDAAEGPHQIIRLFKWITG